MAMPSEPESEPGLFSPPPTPTKLTRSPPLPVLLLYATGTSISLSFTLGLLHGSRTTSLRFTAENAHRTPKTIQGWYFYHKSKNYVVALGGIQEGLRRVPLGLGGAVGWVCVMGAVDEARGRADAGGSVVGGAAMGGAWALWNRYPLMVSAKMVKMGLVTGLGVGLAQDFVAVAGRGREVAYWEWAKRSWRGVRGQRSGGVED